MTKATRAELEALVHDSLHYDLPPGREHPHGDGCALGRLVPRVVDALMQEWDLFRLPREGEG